MSSNGRLEKLIDSKIRDALHRYLKDVEVGSYIDLNRLGELSDFKTQLEQVVLPSFSRCKKAIERQQKEKTFRGCL